MSILVKYLRLTTSISVPDSELRQRFPESLEQTWRNMVFNCPEEDLPEALNEEICLHCRAQIADDLGQNESNIESVIAFNTTWHDVGGGYHGNSVPIVVQLAPPATRQWEFNYSATVVMYAACRWIPVLP